MPKGKYKPRPQSGGDLDSTTAAMQYYLDLENTLSLLAQADAERGTGLSGETMRFYNMHRDAKNSVVPSVFPADALYESGSFGGAFRNAPFERGMEWLGGDTKPFVPKKTFTQNPEYDFLKENYLDPSLESLGSYEVALGQGGGNEYSWGRDVSYTAPDNFVATRLDYPTLQQVEIDPDTVALIKLALRAGVALPVEAQLVLDRYLGQNSFLQQEALYNATNGLPYEMTSTAMQNFVNSPFTEKGAGTDSAAFVNSFGTPTITWKPSYLDEALAFDPYDLGYVARHEYGHVVDQNVGRVETESNPWGSHPSLSEEYKQVRAADASYALPNFDASKLSWNTRNGRPLYTDRENITDYGSRNSTEDFGERWALYMADRNDGWIAADQNRKYRFADLFPATAAYFDSLIGLFPPSNGFAR